MASPSAVGPERNMADQTLQKPLAPPATVAFIGLGKMGAPMASNLAAAGYPVRAHDVAPAAVASFAEGRPGVFRAGSAAQAAAGADVVITMLPDGKIVRKTVLDGGVASSLERGATIVDMSSSSPVETQALGADLAAMGLGLVDAPVSGGVKKAVEGKLAIMAGGDPALVQRVRPILATMGAVVYETGPLGTGHAMKALNNFVSAAGLVATCEALIVGRRFGLDPDKMVDILNASTGRNNSTEVKAKQFILSETFASGFSLALMAKDLRTAADLAAHLGLAAPMSTAASQLWMEASRALGAGADHTEIFRFVERLGR